jgi:hypothetical protein
MVNSLMLLAVEAKSRNRAAVDDAGARRQRRSSRSEINGQRKIHAAFEATSSLMAGASGDKIVHQISTACSGKCEAPRPAQLGPP